MAREKAQFGAYMSFWRQGTRRTSSLSPGTKPNILKPKGQGPISLNAEQTTGFHFKTVI